MKTGTYAIGSRDYARMKRILRENGYKSRSRVLSSRKRTRFSAHEKAALSRMIKSFARKNNLTFAKEGGVLRIGENPVIVKNGLIEEVIFSGTRSECLEFIAKIKSYDKNVMYKITLDNPTYNPLLNDGIGFFKPNSAKTLRDVLRGILESKPEKSLDYERANHKKGQKTIFYVVKVSRV